MTKKFLIFSLILNLLLTAGLIFTVGSSQTQVYTFSGENDDIEISDGTIVKNKAFEHVAYGSFRYIGEVPENAYKFALKLYCTEGSEQVVLYRSAAELNPDHDATVTKEFVMQNNESICQSTYGKAARKLTDVSRESIINNLYFEIIFTTTDQKEITQTLKLNVAPVQN